MQLKQQVQLTQQVQLKQQVHLTAWASSRPSNARPLPATSHPPPPCLTCRHPRGPGCSSVGGGFLTEMGPWYPRQDRSLKANPHSWNKWANMLFVEVRWRGSWQAAGARAGCREGLGALQQHCVLAMLQTLHVQLAWQHAATNLCCCCCTGGCFANRRLRSWASVTVMTSGTLMWVSQGRHSSHTLGCGVGCCQLPAARLSVHHTIGAAPFCGIGCAVRLARAKAKEQR